MVANRGMSRLAGVERGFRPLPASASEARRFVTETLHGWDDDEIADTAIAVTNELFINAVTHAHTEITVRLRRLAGAVISEIEDLDFREPQRHQPTDEDEHFRGLQVVDALSTRWGCRATTTGKVVWAELTIDDAQKGRRSSEAQIHGYRVQERRSDIPAHRSSPVTWRDPIVEVLTDVLPGTSLDVLPDTLPDTLPD